MIYISIVEDDDAIRDGLALLINSNPDFKCNHTYPDCETAIKNLGNQLPDIILMDIGLPGMNGIEGTRKIKALFPDVEIIVLTVHENDEMVFDALCAGASGYLVKETSPKRVLEAIQEVRNGGSPMSTQIARMVVLSFKRKPDSSLTERENEVLSQLCMGKSYKTIADSLFISEETVRKHLKSIYRKLEVHSKSEAVAKAIRDKLV